jgi:hypothetical protein
MILGGSCNCVDMSKWNSTIIQGCRNTMSAACSIILAGSGITASAPFTAYASNFCVAGGKYYGDGSSLTGLDLTGIPIILNSSISSIIIGLSTGRHSISATSPRATVINGCCNQIFGNSCLSTIIGGNNNSICDACNSITLAGSSNFTCASVCYAYMLGGFNSNICNSSCHASIIGSTASLINCSIFSSIVGGQSNSISSLSCNSSIVAGQSNFIYCTFGSVVLGGYLNCVSGSVGVYARTSVILGGCSNTLTNTTGSVILGGSFITGTAINTAYANNFCAYNGKYYGDGSALTGIAGATTSVSTVTGTGYAISSSNYNNIIRYSGDAIANSGLFTLPSGIAGFTVGGSVMVVQVASGQAYFTGAAGTTVLVNGSKSKTSAKGATMTFTYTATDEWLVNGDVI